MKKFDRPRCKNCGKFIGMTEDNVLTIPHYGHLCLESETFVHVVCSKKVKDDQKKMKEMNNDQSHGKPYFENLKQEDQKYILDDMILNWAAGESINHIYYEYVRGKSGTNDLDAEWDIAECIYCYAQYLKINTLK